MATSSHGATGQGVAQSNAPNFEADIDVDTSVDGGDSDSALGSEDGSLRSASVTSSVYGYRYENGRRYHAYREGKYLLPNDEAEQDRLDLHHHIFQLTLGGHLFRAPIDPNPQRVLDFGTGTGIWAIDFADEFPSASVIGTDLSPIQPSFVPPNCKFYVDDVESEWTFNADEAFDFIHGRGMGGSISDWDALYRRVYENLKPGGWVEMQEYEAWIGSEQDPSMSRTPAFEELTGLIIKAGEKFGKRFDIAQEQKQKMIDAGFVDVHDDVYKVPLGTWPKDPKLKQIGMYQREHMILSVESFTLALLTRVLNWSIEETQVLMAKVKAEFRDPEARLLSMFHFVYGRKPSG